jgi:hypothetical protein
MVVGEVASVRKYDKAFGERKVLLAWLGVAERGAKWHLCHKSPRGGEAPSLGHTPINKRIIVL